MKRCSRPMGSSRYPSSRFTICSTRSCRSRRRRSTRPRCKQAGASALLTRSRRAARIAVRALHVHAGRGAGSLWTAGVAAGGAGAALRDSFGGRSIAPDRIRSAARRRSSVSAGRPTERHSKCSGASARPTSHPSARWICLVQTMSAIVAAWIHTPGGCRGRHAPRRDAAAPRAAADGGRSRVS